MYEYARIDTHIHGNSLGKKSEIYMHIMTVAGNCLGEEWITARVDKNKV